MQPYLYSMLLFLIAIPFIIGLTSQTLVEDLMEFLHPSKKLRQKSIDVQKNRQESKLYTKLVSLRSAMEASHKGNYFPLLFTIAAILCALSLALSAALDNVFLLPTFLFLSIKLPFSYVNRAIEEHERNMNNEMETALSVVTNSYIRTNNIIMAVTENLDYIKPPLRILFEQFLSDYELLGMNIKQALFKLRNKTGNLVFNEWCTTLIQCQDDSTLKDNLQPIVGKLTDMRIVNEQMKSMLISVKIEYWTMASFTLCAVPLLKFMNPEWYEIMLSTTPGKFVIGMCLFVVAITHQYMKKWTKPLQYGFDKKGNRKEKK